MSETTAGAVDRRTQTASERDALLFDFGVDSFKLGPAHTQFLEETAKFLDAVGTPAMVVSLDGFASHTGSAQHNQVLSEKREQAVENFLKARTKSLGPGQRHTLNRNFKGFSDSPAGENPRFRSVRVVVHSPSVVPPPVPVVPKPPAAATVGKFEVDLIGWIPQAEVDNPLAKLPGFVAGLLPAGMADPFFGGDNFTIPGRRPLTTTAGHTFRATQHLDFTIGAFGMPAVIGSSTVTPGVTTCLDKKRAAGGKVTFSLTATLVRHEEKVTFSASDDWYEIVLSGVVLDPVPAAAARVLTSKLPGLPAALRLPASTFVSKLATAVTPSLSWSVTLRLQRGAVLGTKTKLEYLPFFGVNDASSLAGAGTTLGPGSDLIHGDVHFNLWPSAVIFLTFTPTGGTSVTQPIFFSDGSGVPSPQPLFIEVPKLCKLRQLTWKA